VFGVSASTAVRLVSAQRTRGTVVPRPRGRALGTAGRLAGHRAFLLEVVKAEPDITLRELSGALLEAEGVAVALSSPHRALKAAGQTDKGRPDRQRA
jgi:transposase